MKTKFTGYWTFFSNPQRWNIDEFLLTAPEHTVYMITTWQQDMFSPGQKGIIRVAIDKRTDRLKLLPSGVYAFVEVTSKPRIRGDFDMDFWNKPKPKLSNRLCVKIKITKNLIHNPLLISVLKENPAIDDAYLINGGYGFYSSMPLTKRSYEALETLVNRK